MFVKYCSTSLFFGKMLMCVNECICMSYVAWSVSLNIAALLLYVSNHLIYMCMILVLQTAFNLLLNKT